MRVVNSYEAASEKVPVSFVRSVDLPTDGKPTMPTRASPTLFTSNPSPLAPPPPPPDGSISSRRSLASLALSIPKWPAVALFFCVRAISASISAILLSTDMMI